MGSIEQAIDSERFMVVPRTVIFLRRSDSYLLIKGAADKKRWPNKYNGIGGHVERGEDVMTSAARELREETGLEANLWLCGTTIINAEDAGVALYVFSGDVSGGTLHDSMEGTMEWVPYQNLSHLNSVDDLQALLAHINRMHRGDPPFAAWSAYDDQGRLRIHFEEEHD